MNPRILMMLALGFSSGLPLALTSSTLQAWFTQSGLSLATIGALSLVGLPYLFKVFWSPLMDRFVPPFLGRRRGWILCTQLGLSITLIILANMHPETQASHMGFLALLIAFIAASQDISIDAYRTDILLPEERGVGSATFIFAYRIALLVSAGLVLVLADHLGWRITYDLMGLLMALSIIPTLLAPKSADKISHPATLSAAITEPFKDLLKREAIILILLFIVFYKIGDALALSLMMNFLLHGLGFSLTQIGVAYKTVSLIGVLLGAFLGGSLMTRIGLYRALLLFGLMQAGSTLLFMLMALVGKNMELMITSIFIENLCSGMSTTAFFAFLMSLCNKHYTATQYAFFSALFSLGRVLLGPVAALMVIHWGWVTFYAWSFGMSFPGILMLILLPRTVIARSAFCDEAI